MKFVLWPATVLARVIVAVLGFALLLAGVVVTLTAIGAFVGIPIAVVGLLLLVRGVF